MSHSEMLQVVDPNTGEPTGENVSRKKLYEKKLWCRTTNIYVLNSLGQVLCHQRALDKERYGGAWSTHFGGHVTEGESFKISALKYILPFQLIPWRTSKITASRIWVRDFITVYDGDIKNLKIQEEEVQHIKWFDVQDIVDELDAENIYNYKSTEWLAGTHDFNADYQCMRAVLTATIDIGIFGGDYRVLRNWHPLTAAKENKF